MWVYYTRVGGSPKKIMVLVATLGMDVTEDALIGTKKIINIYRPF